MNRLLYNVLLHSVAAPFLAALYTPQILFGRKYRRSVYGKLGRLPGDFDPERLPRPRVWFHAVSVGEVKALEPLVKALKTFEPDAATLISTGTETGQDTARSSISQADGFFYMPLDFHKSDCAGMPSPHARPRHQEYLTFQANPDRCAGAQPEKKCHDF